MSALRVGVKPSQSSSIGPLERLRHVHEGMLSGAVVGTSLAAAGGVAAILGVLGPMGIETSLDPGSRVAFATLCCFLGWPPCHALSAALLHLMRHRSPLKILIAWALGVAFLALPCSAFGYAVYRLFDIPGPVDRVLPEAYLCALTLVLLSSSLVHAVAWSRSVPRPGAAPGRGAAGAGRSKRPNRSRQRAGAPVPAEKSARGSLLDRIPRGLGQDIVYITVAGHYVKVVTTTGFCLVRIRFADAIAEMGETGIQLHRSYWVAFRHIVATLRRDDRMTVRVTGSVELPVSRSRTTAVRAAMADTSRTGSTGDGARLPFGKSSVTGVGVPQRHFSRLGTPTTVTSHRGFDGGAANRTSGIDLESVRSGRPPAVDP